MVGEYVKPKDWNALISDPDTVSVSSTTVIPLSHHQLYTSFCASIFTFCNFITISYVNYMHNLCCRLSLMCVTCMRYGLENLREPLIHVQTHSGSLQLGLMINSNWLNLKTRSQESILITDLTHQQKAPMPAIPNRYLELPCTALVVSDARRHQAFS